MKISYKKQASGFTLIEMIGVLAVIAILAALLIPKIFEAINNSRINNAAMSVQTIKTALADHYAKFGSLAVVETNTAGVKTVVPLALPETSFDTALLTEGFIDKPFYVKVGDGIKGAANTRVQVRAAGTDVTTAVDGANFAYNLDGAAPLNDATGSHVVEAVITGVALNDAIELNNRIDGPALGAATGNDFVGRVKYADAASTTVFVYLTHR